MEEAVEEVPKNMVSLLWRNFNQLPFRPGRNGAAAQGLMGCYELGFEWCTFRE